MIHVHDGKMVCAACGNSLDTYHATPGHYGPPQPLPQGGVLTPWVPPKVIRPPYIAVVLRSYSGRSDENVGRLHEYVIHFCPGCITSAPAFMATTLDKIFEKHVAPETRPKRPDKNKHERRD
jgi:hypothetical protein